MNSRKPLKYILELITFRGLESFGRHYSCYRGFVMENRDIKGMDRIFVSVPHISGRREEGNWAWPKGKSHTNRELPKVGDMVWVEFERGDYRFPVWSFCNQTRKLDMTSEHDPNSQKHVTEKGSSVEMNDTTEEVTIHHFSGADIKMTKDTIDIRSKDGGQVQLKGEEVLFNGGENGGMINISKLVEKIRTLEMWMNTHQHAIAPGTPTIPLSPTPFIPVRTTVSELENTKVKH